MTDIADFMTDGGLQDPPPVPTHWPPDGYVFRKTELHFDWWDPGNIDREAFRDAVDRHVLALLHELKDLRAVDLGANGVMFAEQESA